MKLFTAFVLAFLLTLGACELSPEQRSRVQTGLVTATDAVDLNHDGVVTNAEIKAAPNSPMAWIEGLNGILVALGLLGGGGVAAKAMSASKAAAKAQEQVDELYDRTHAPIAITAKPS